MPLVLAGQLRATGGPATFSDQTLAIDPAGDCFERGDCDGWKPPILRARCRMGALHPSYTSQLPAKAGMTGRMLEVRKLLPVRNS